MSMSGLRYVVATCARLLGGTFLLATPALAQQITYYDFDAPQASSGFSYACTDPAHGIPPVPNPLFCFNDGTGAAANSSLLSDTYPPFLDPVTTDNPPASSTHFTIQVTPSTASQASSLWFSVPQRVSDGFTSWFAFKITPNANSFATADGIAFVIQNSAGSAAGTADGTACTETGSGPSVVGGAGGCMGYGGIDNSLAIELDTYRNQWDPGALGPATFNDNHIAVQSCGPGLVNSPAHGGSCLASLSGIAGSGINTLLPITLADGNPHQVVVTYSGPTEATPNQLQIFLDPTFVAGTHTPVPGSVPILSGTYNITTAINLMSSGTANDSAYIGFTSATGSAFEQHQLMAWTFTPHTPVTQQQPLSPPGQPTTFPFGSHVYGVTYPTNGPDTSGIDMVVTANTVTPAFFTQLIGASTFAGSQCQVYDETGGNCVIYSVSCLTHGTTTVVPCPASSDPSSLISVKSAYNNSAQPISPGYLQGDPLYSAVGTISGNGNTATVTCTGECSVTQGQTVTIAGATTVGNTPSPFDGTITVLAADPNVPDTFTFASGVAGSASGGYLTSSNVKNVFTSYTPQRIDGSTTGKTKNFSDFVVTSLTAAPTTLMIQAPSVTFGSAALVTIVATSPNGTPTGNVVLTVDNGAPLTQALANGSAIFSVAGLSAGSHTLSVSYSAQGVFQAAMQTGNVLVSQATPTVTVTSDTPNPSNVNSAVALTFTVASGGGVPTGSYTVISSAGGDPSCSGTLVSGAGSCSLTFLTAGPRTLTIKYSGDANFSSSSATVQQNVIAVGVASVSPNRLDFGTVYQGSIHTKFLTLTNTGGATLTISEQFLSIVGGGNSNEFLALSLCPSKLAPGKSCIILIAFVAGPVYTPQTAVLMITDSAANSPQQVPLSAVVINPKARFKPSSLSFGTHSIGSQSVSSLVLWNSGSTPLAISHIGIAGANPADFTQSNACPPSLTPGASCNINVTFTPHVSGSRSARIVIMDNTDDGTDKAALSGSAP